MKKLFFLSILLILSHVGLAATTADSIDEWKSLTVSTVRDFLYEKRNKDLLAQCSRFLEIPDMVSIYIPPKRAQLRHISQYIKGAHGYVDFSTPENFVLGGVICGLGGGPHVSALFERGTGKLITIVPLPGR